MSDSNSDDIKITTNTNCSLLIHRQKPMNTNFIHHYPNYDKSCPRINHVINTELYPSNGVFIQELNHVQQELEAVRISAMQRYKRLKGFNNRINSSLTITDTSTTDCSVDIATLWEQTTIEHDDESDRESVDIYQKICSNRGSWSSRGRPFHGTWLRGRKRGSGRGRGRGRGRTLRIIKRERGSRSAYNGFIQLAPTTNIIHSTLNTTQRQKNKSIGNCTRQRTYRTLNSHGYHDISTPNRNGKRLKLNNSNTKQVVPEQFWINLTSTYHQFVNQNDIDELNSLVNFDQDFLQNIQFLFSSSDDEQDHNNSIQYQYEKYQELLNKNQHLDQVLVPPTLFSNPIFLQYFKCSIAVKRNHIFKKNVELVSNEDDNIDLKTKTVQQSSTYTRNKNHQSHRNHVHLSPDSKSIKNRKRLTSPTKLKSFRKLAHSETKMSRTTKLNELNECLQDCIFIEQKAHERAKHRLSYDEVCQQIQHMDTKISDIMLSCRYRKKNILDTKTPLVTTQSWRQRPRKSTLRLYEELKRLLNDRVTLEAKANWIHENYLKF
ncbi:unnamed protein product [Didymodactylos carnosus]|uniref:Uncharacterized protein n=1 Tax=Didymodactylos carnosus TaxID=1234261 RepID=A0A813R9C6_9BILA|nr:unnamed protein product [Didymodactylos carnosus]CAF0803399.1 unnamed protein product [Didymodactylos carnosus]CAF3561859.1 unnamed protein product [Didymodactylos carnosus]CAF3586893.1 unnamed protein product [Didymodactylos carnosus]